MKTRTIALLCLVALVVASLGGCASTVTPFSRAMGRAVWVQQSTPTLWQGGGDSVVLPDGYVFVADWGRHGYMLARPQEGYTLYGVWRDGAWVLPCSHIALTRAGNFYMGAYYRDEALQYDVYNAQGTIIAGTKSDATLYPLDDTHFVLYSAGKAQVADDQGKPYFINNLFTTADSFAMCGDYLLSYRASDFSCRVWQLALDARGEGMAMLLHTFAAPDTRYTAVYCGGRFLVTALSAATADDYTYMDLVDGNTQYLRQQAWWYDPNMDELTKANLDFVLLGVRGTYAPGAAEADKQAIALAEGYTAVSVAVTNSQRLRESTRTYVMDKEGHLVLAYPADINPTALAYREDVGYLSAKQTAACLYGLDGNLLWQDARYAYTAMVWQNERLVAAYSDQSGTYYGAFDVVGDVVVPFQYEYVAPFVQGVSMAKRADGYVRLNHNGVETQVVTDIACEAYWLGYGCYVYASKGLYGLKNLGGDVVLDADWQSLDLVGRNSDGQTYVVGRKGNALVQQVLQ